MKLRRVMWTATAMAGLAMVGLVGTGWAFTEHPIIKVTPTLVFTDNSGCGSVLVSGTGFQPSTQTHPNSAQLDVTDSEGGAFWQDTGLSSTQVPVDALGRFAAVRTVCEPFLVPGDVFTISALDENPGVDSNAVRVTADHRSTGHILANGRSVTWVTTNGSGCAAVTFTGTHFTGSTATTPNSAQLTLSDGPFFDQDAVFQATGTKTDSVPVNADGYFRARLTLCDPSVTNPDSWSVSSVDTFTGLPGTSVAINAH